MSQWDGLPENPPTMLLGAKGQKAWQKVVGAVVAAQKPATEAQLRVITDARQEMVTEILTDPEFDPGNRVAELEGQLVEHVRALDELLPELAAWKGALAWANNVMMPFKPVQISSRGPVFQRLRRAETVSVVDLMLALREALGITAEPAAHASAREGNHNPFKHQGEPILTPTQRRSAEARKAAA